MLSDDQYQTLHDGEAMQEMIESQAWKLFMERVDKIREGLVSRMVAGQDDYAAYRELVGMHKAIDDILVYPGELVDQANELRRMLSNDE